MQRLKEDEFVAGNGAARYGGRLRGRHGVRPRPKKYFRDPSGLAPEKEKGDRVLGTASGYVLSSVALYLAMNVSAIAGSEADKGKKNDKFGTLDADFCDVTRMGMSNDALAYWLKLEMYEKVDRWFKSHNMFFDIKYDENTLKNTGLTESQICDRAVKWVYDMISTEEGDKMLNGISQRQRFYIINLTLSGKQLASNWHDSKGDKFSFIGGITTNPIPSECALPAGGKSQGKTSLTLDKGVVYMAYEYLLGPVESGGYEYQYQLEDDWMANSLLSGLAWKDAYLDGMMVLSHETAHIYDRYNCDRPMRGDDWENSANQRMWNVWNQFYKGVRKEKIYEP